MVGLELSLAILTTLAHTVQEDIKAHGGQMTKDLAVCVHGNNPPRSKYLSTSEFFDAIDTNLKRALAAGK